MKLESGGFAATKDGEVVVELGRIDEPVIIFSGTKGLVAMCMLLLIERGQLDLDVAVSDYWPEFRHRDVLVRHVVSHTAGLPGLRPPPTAEDLLDPERMAERITAGDTKKRGNDSNDEAGRDACEKLPPVHK